MQSQARSPAPPASTNAAALASARPVRGPAGGVPGGAGSASPARRAELLVEGGAEGRSSFYQHNGGEKNPSWARPADGDRFRLSQSYIAGASEYRFTIDDQRSIRDLVSVTAGRARPWSRTAAGG